jgi:hypothetical protein
MQVKAHEAMHDVGLKPSTMNQGAQITVAFTRAISKM